MDDMKKLAEQAILGAELEHWGREAVKHRPRVEGIIPSTLPLPRGLLVRHILVAIEEATTKAGRRMLDFRAELDQARKEQVEVKADAANAIREAQEAERRGEAHRQKCLEALGRAYKAEHQMSREVQRRRAAEVLAAERLELLEREVRIAEGYLADRARYLGALNACRDHSSEVDRIIDLAVRT